MRQLLTAYRQQMQHELTNILSYWINHTQDIVYGGFYGKIDNANYQHIHAPKGVVLNARILWTFSEAYHTTGYESYLEMADRAYQYLLHHFFDKEYGGVYWSVDYKGAPLDTKKQVYAQAFVVYGISAYYQCRPDKAVQEQAIALYKAIVQFSYDTVYGGYIEALTREWNPIADLRLSEKDANERKSMNTNLHVLEAFTTLYRIWQNDVLKQRIAELIRIFLQYITAEDYHLLLFFNDEWQPKSEIVSYGHDIEAAWLILEAAEVIGDNALLEEVKAWSVSITDAAAEGLDEDGGLWYEYDKATNHWMHEKHWWPQAEAMVGFFNAWQLTGNAKYLEQSVQTWEFTRNHILDKEGGEWFWGVKEDYSIMNGEDKAGFWKCPYHNGRACIELIRRINESLSHNSTLEN
ncbi:mannobiose 2-epimerase [Filimonas lacunae]|uniref:Cellobiose 2-epimerase n=1 Tax=Filimonas lacunae TaxID=477680 RepID=A0A173MPB4_9BACT|nr:AGE family epimerase/isomerase [Filimonas lacunae]BAV09482.1 N-acylglucosamine 2-epimerase [Filimonas lacunae]SIS73955.1 mannobiose 2-epimerase [Filimonas lacunae]